MKALFNFIIALTLVCCGVVDLVSQVTIDKFGAPGDPHLLLLENATGSSRLYFQNANSTSGQYWGIASKIGATDGTSRLHFYHQGSTSAGYVLSMTAEKHVGIGTFLPSARLTVQQSVNSSDMGLRIVSASGFYTGNIWMDGQDLRIHEDNSGVNGFVIKPDKKIGIFTSSPQSKFDIYETDFNSNDDLFSVRKRLNLFSTQTIFAVQADHEVYALKLGVNKEEPTDRVHINTDGPQEHALRVQIQGATKLRVLSNGGTSIGTNNTSPPGDGLYIHGNVEIGDASQILMFNGSGNQTIRLDSDFGGDGRIITDELQITGGSDLAEQFDIIDPKGMIAPGMLVSIDPNRAGKLTISRTAYDKKLAGIISGANGIQPGMMMGQYGSLADGDYPVALAGRVYVYANVEGGAIQPGDLITSSSRPGFAMKVSDYSLAQGAIVGKAMTALEHGYGYVLILVSLQ